MWAGWELGCSRFRFLEVGKEDVSMSLIKRAYRSRLSPTAEQCQVLARTFGCCRWVSNQALARKTAAYREAGQRRSYGDLSALLPLWKSQAETKWLGEGSWVPLQHRVRHAGPAPLSPSLKDRRRTRTSRRTMGAPPATSTASAFSWQDGRLTLAKMPAALDIRWSRPLPEEAHPTTVTVSRDAAGRYCVCLLVEAERAPLPVSPRAVGIDLGLHDVVRLSTGEKTGNERSFAKEEKRLARLQRRHARQHKGSKQREKARRRVAKLPARSADRRQDFQHQLTTRLIGEKQTGCVERLAVKQMLQHPTRSKAIADVGWGELLRQREDQATWYGRTLVKMDRRYPSSTTSSGCGFVLETLDVEEREWTCPRCGTVHDRDTNAAQTMLAEGLRQSAVGLTVAAWGGGGRPNLDGIREGIHR